MRSIVFLFIFFFCGITLAQKRVLKQWDASQMKSLSFEAHYVSKIKIIETQGDQLIVSATMEGEYANELFVGLIQQENGAWDLITSFESFGDTPNDKLAAHKVKSLELLIKIPATRKLYVISPRPSLVIERL